MHFDGIIKDYKSVSTCAVIVTYNRITLLKRCVSALINQSVKLDCILVVNNGSYDGTSEWLSLHSDLKVINQANLGGSGGFYSGCKYAAENDFDYVWLMDDDGYPTPNALEELMKGQLFGTAVLNCLVVTDDHNPLLSFPIRYFNEKLDTYDQVKSLNSNYIIGQIHPFNGTLIPTSIFSKIGLPYGDMFVWGDEREYFFRMISFGIPLATIVNSLFYHPLDKNSNEIEWNNGLMWKKYYLFRNMYRVIKSSGSEFPNFKYFKFIFFQFFNIIKTQKHKKFEKIAILLLAYYHSITNVYGNTPAELNILKKYLKNI